MRDTPPGYTLLWWLVGCTFWWSWKCYPLRYRRQGTLDTHLGTPSKIWSSSLRQMRLWLRHKGGDLLAIFTELYTFLNIQVPSFAHFSIFLLFCCWQMSPAFTESFQVPENKGISQITYSWPTNASVWNNKRPHSVNVTRKYDQNLYHTKPKIIDVYFAVSYFLIKIISFGILRNSNELITYFRKVDSH